MRGDVLVRVLQRNRGSRIHIYIERERERGRERERERERNLQGRLAVWRPREELMLQLETKAVWRQNAIFPEGPPSFPLKAFHGWDEAQPIMEGNMLYSKSTDLNGNLI